MKNKQQPTCIYEFRIKRLRCAAGENALSYGSDKGVLRDATAAAEFLRTRLIHQDREHFFVVHFDIRNRVVGYEVAAIGGMHGVEVHPREIFRGAIVAGSAGILVAHNHPSGDPEPSAEDDLLTKRIAATSKLMGIPLMDHIVIGGDRHVSYLENRNCILTEV